MQGPQYDTQYDTLLCATKLVTSYLDHHFQKINFHNNKFNIVIDITLHQIALQGLKCRALVRNMNVKEY